MKNKIYLGDSVYAHQDDRGGILIYLDNGLGAFHQIFLEPEVMMALNEYITRLFLPERCIYEFADVKFCSNRQKDCKKCQQCFS